MWLLGLALLPPAANHLDVLCSFFALCTIINFLYQDLYSHVLSLGAMGALVMFVVSAAVGARAGGAPRVPPCA